MRAEGGERRADLRAGQRLEVEDDLGVRLLRVDPLHSLVPPERGQRVHVGREPARQVHLHHGHVGRAAKTELLLSSFNSALAFSESVSTKCLALTDCAHFFLRVPPVCLGSRAA